MVNNDPLNTFSTGTAKDRLTLKQVQVLAPATLFAFEGRFKSTSKEGCTTGAKAVCDKVFLCAANLAFFRVVAHNCIPLRMIVRAFGPRVPQGVRWNKIHAPKSRATIVVKRHLVTSGAALRLLV